jgi:hypothetical protein
VYSGKRIGGDDWIRILVNICFPVNSKYGILPTLSRALFAIPQIFATTDSEYNACRAPFEVAINSSESGIGGVTRPLPLGIDLVRDVLEIFYERISRMNFDVQGRQACSRYSIFNMSGMAVFCIL